MQTGEIQELETLGGDASYAFGISADGRFVVGWAENDSGDVHAVRWDMETGLTQDLGTLGGGSSWAASISSDGRYVVGWAEDDSGDVRAVLWDAIAGIVENLSQAYGSLLAGDSFLKEARAILPDSRYIVGVGFNAVSGRWREAFWLDAQSSTDLGDDGNNPWKITVESAFSSPDIHIDFALPKLTFVTLEIYNLLGYHVATLVDRLLPAGEHQVRWTLPAIPGGIYLCHIRAGELRQLVKLMVVR